jgi:hypothetical protein
MSGAGEFGVESLGPEEHMRCMEEKRKQEAKPQEIIKPCPFCGTPARCEDGEHELNIKTSSHKNVDLDHGGIVTDAHYAYCIMCFAHGPSSATEEEAIHEWNNAKWVWWAEEPPGRQEMLRKIREGLPPLHERNRMTALECALKLIRRECEYEDQEHMIGCRVRDLVDSVIKGDK